MKIVINDFNSVPYWLRLEIAMLYLKEHESQKLVEDPFLSYDRKIKETSKYPIIIERGCSNWYVKCRKTKTSYIFDIWKAV